MSSRAESLRRTESFLAKLLRLAPATSQPQDRRPAASTIEAAQPLSRQMHQPEYGQVDAKPVDMTTVTHPDGRMTQYPPPSHWDDWVQWDGKHWPTKVAHRYALVPTTCFNCEAACGLLAYVDKSNYEIRKFEGNPAHPSSRGRNCAKGPATHNQTYDPERILHPLKRVGPRGSGKWARISWDEALEEIAERMRESRKRRLDGIMYHVGRPGEDHYTNRVISAWGVDGHNSHTNICSAAARAGYAFWSGADRPSPDFARAKTILLISAHLESGHYFNPHAQRIVEGQAAGAKIITFDPRLSNTAARSDLWLPSWPGSEAVILLAIANHLIQHNLYNRDFVRRWVNWEQTLREAPSFVEDEATRSWIEARLAAGDPCFEDFEELLKKLYAEYTFERAAQESEVPVDRIQQAAELVAEAGTRLACHNWRAAAMGNRGGWQVSRCLLFLNVLTGSLGTRGGTFMNSWNKFVPKPFAQPPAFEAWNELHLPDEWPFAHYEMSFLLPHFLDEGRGDVDVYFTRVYNPLWINPDGFRWIEALRDEEKIKCHVALTPTWNESAWFADYVLPMGHAGERHDLMSQETYAGTWIAFRQPVRRVAMERDGIAINRTYEANPGEVWEEAEFWIDLSVKMDPDGSLGIRKWFDSPYRPGEAITVEEYFRWIFENSVPGLPEAAEAEGLTPLGYMRKYGAFELNTENYAPYEQLKATSLGGVDVDGVGRVGFTTPSKKLEFFSPTLRDWGWKEQAYVIPWHLPSHVSRDEIDRGGGEMLLLPTFRLPNLIHTRSANAKWLYEISHKNPVWMHPEDAQRLGVDTGDLVHVETEIGFMVDTVWVTEGIKPGVIAVSHHLGRWRTQDGGEHGNIGSGMSSLVELSSDAEGLRRLRIERSGGPWQSTDPDTARIFWEDVGVHQNLIHGVHPDPVSGAHCWHQKAIAVRKAAPGQRRGDIEVDLAKSQAVYRQWVDMARPASVYSPDGTRRPYWLKRPLKPTKKAYLLPGRDPEEPAP
ncbi:MAG: molybdopterin-dependent oxidoreductase [Myxococcales bacterium]|nr:molybdopterin-dependent oxidoreductase [Myxococcales bacterium]